MHLYRNPELKSGWKANLDFYKDAIDDITGKDEKISIRKMKDFFHSFYFSEKNRYSLEFEKFRLYGTIEDLDFRINGFQEKENDFECIFKISPFLRPNEFIEKGYLKTLFTKATVVVNIKAIKGTINEFKKFRNRNNLPNENILR